MVFFLSFLWFIRTTKVILFYLYLWQLKEYHIGRFLDHFRTEKGKRLILNKINLLKLGLLSGPFIFASIFPFLIIFLYLGEACFTFKNFFQKKLRKPVLTKKTALLILVALILEVLVLLILSQNVNDIVQFSFWILVIDIFTPALTSLIVLCFQPLAVLGRSQIIKKAKKKRESLKDLLVIGITGSYGKTSTKEFLATILAEKFKVLKTAEHQNSEVGISQCILDDLKSEHQIFVVEMGAYNRGGIKLLCDITKPKIGILTGINEQHMATFGSLENIIKTKYELIESLPENGLAIFNGSNPYTFRLYLKTEKPKKVYRHQAIADRVEPDIFAKDIVMAADSIGFRVFPKGEQPFDLKINVLGAQNVGNILAAILVARELGCHPPSSLPLRGPLTWEEIFKGCQKIRPEQGTMQLKKGINGINIIDSTYSANPDGVIADLDYLKIYPTLAKKVIVMPCLIELGKASKEVHRRIGQKIAEVCDLAIITTKDRFKEIKDYNPPTTLLPERQAPEILFMENPKEIFEKIKNSCKEGDVILLESRVPVGLIKQLIIRDESI